jgi:hypothetical protein
VTESNDNIKIIAHESHTVNLTGDDELFFDVNSLATLLGPNKVLDSNGWFGADYLAFGFARGSGYQVMHDPRPTVDYYTRNLASNGPVWSYDNNMTLFDLDQPTLRKYLLASTPLLAFDTSSSEVPTSANTWSINQPQAITFNAQSTSYTGLLNIQSKDIEDLIGQTIGGKGGSRYHNHLNTGYQQFCDDKMLDSGDFPQPRFFSQTFKGCDSGEIYLSFDSYLGGQAFSSNVSHKWSAQSKSGANEFAATQPLVAGLAAIEVFEGKQRVTDQLVNAHQAAVVIYGYQDEQYTLKDVQLQIQLDGENWVDMPLTAYEDVTNAYQAQLTLPDERTFASLRLRYSTPSLVTTVHNLNGFFNIGLQDADQDQLDDDWETENGLDPTNATDALLDIPK